jgi:hypothetical protein
MNDKASELKALQQIPGVGKRIANDLWNLGIHAVGDLKGRDPDDLYNTLCNQTGVKVDRCMLYVFRCAVYYASNVQPDPELLKWWHWKDRAEQPAQAVPIASSA